MKLLELDTRGFRGAPDGTYSFADPRTRRAADVVLITGEASSGKTSLLEAIVAIKEATAPYGMPPAGKDLLRRASVDGLVRATWVLSPAEIAEAGLETERVVVEWRLAVGGDRPRVEPRVGALFARYSHHPGVGKFEYFPTNRRLHTGSWSALPPHSESAERAIRLTRHPEKYASLRSMLADLATADADALSEIVTSAGVVVANTRPDSLAPFRSGVELVLPDLRLCGVSGLGTSRDVVFVRRSGARVRLSDLSDFEQQGVLFALTFRRIGLNRSVVLVDGPELHVHPTEQPRFLEALGALGHDNQIIAATSSERLLRSTCSYRVIELPTPRSSAA